MITESYKITELWDGHYEGQVLDLAKINYFIGVNGSLKSQLLWKLKTDLGSREL